MRQQSVKKTIQMTGKELKNSILQLAISGKLVLSYPEKSRHKKTTAISIISIISLKNGGMI